MTGWQVGRAIAALGAFALIVGFVGMARTELDAAAGAPTERPNLVVIMTDDQTMGSFRPEVMPRTTRLIVGPGTSFEDHVVTTPLCCPSRATYLTGQYAHNHGVFSNRPGYADLTDDESTLPVWLQSAGYRTAYVGKFLHGYEETTTDPAEPAPGFDRWHSMLRPFSYFGFDLSANGRRNSYGDDEYLTSTLTEKAVRVVEREASASDPLFLSLAYWAPHGTRRSPGPCDRAPPPAPQDLGSFDGESLPMPPSFNETDISDKPPSVRDQPSLSVKQIAGLEHRYRCTLESLQEVDRGVKRVYEAFEAVGEADNTVFVFSSDNGYFFGEHRLTGKSRPYEEALRVPLAIRVPAALLPETGPVHRSGAAVANIDLAPTILDLANAVPCPLHGACRILDGRSLMPLMSGQGGWPTHRMVVVESRKNALDGQSCKYAGLRGQGVMYTEHASVLNPRTGECERATEVERYDLEADPFELENLAPAPPASDDRRLERELSGRLAELSRCAGIEGRDPLPESGSYCE